jgi:hypothetical protein
MPQTLLKPTGHHATEFRPDRCVVTLVPPQHLEVVLGLCTWRQPSDGHSGGRPSPQVVPPTARRVFPQGTSTARAEYDSRQG